MKRLALALVLYGLLISGTAAANQTCKAKAIKQKLVGEALLRLRKAMRNRCLYGLRRAGCGKDASRTCQ
jgi:hypothetical protein